MLLYLSFEELAALTSSADALLSAHRAASHGVVAPARIHAEIEQFAERLPGDVNLGTIEEQQQVLGVVRHLVQYCRLRMEEAVLAEHPAAESAVSAYFTFAHVLTVERRVDTVGQEMASIIRVMTGDDPDSDAGRRFTFPD